MKLYEIVNLHEMSNLYQQDTGIPNVVLWAGPFPPGHWLRVKVSNVPNRWSSDNFSVTIPNLDIVGEVNKQLITKQVWENIKEWIKLNADAIEKYEKRLISDEEFRRLVERI